MAVNLGTTIHNHGTYQTSLGRDVFLVLLGAAATAFFTVVMPGWIGKTQQPIHKEHANEATESAAQSSTNHQPKVSIAEKTSPLFHQHVDGVRVQDLSRGKWVGGKFVPFPVERGGHGD